LKTNESDERPLRCTPLDIEGKKLKWHRRLDERYENGRNIGSNTGIVADEIGQKVLS
jgi:hypothetical protein